MVEFSLIGTSCPSLHPWSEAPAAHPPVPTNRERCDGASPIYLVGPPLQATVQHPACAEDPRSAHLRWGGGAAFGEGGEGLGGCGPRLPQYVQSMKHAIHHPACLARLTEEG